MDASKFRRKLLERLSERREEVVKDICRGLPQDHYWKYVGYVEAVEDLLRAVEEVLDDLDGETRRIFHNEN
jgi:hypothetical protein